MPKHLVISTSGNPDSNSRRMGRVAFAHLQRRKADCDWINLREMELPLCDADKCYDMPASKKLSVAIEHADGILIAAPVYNFDVAAATKNMIELTGSAWEDKVVGFVCAAGGHTSYMSVMAYAKSHARLSLVILRGSLLPRATLSMASTSLTKDHTANRTSRRRPGSLHQSAAELFPFSLLICRDRINIPAPSATM